jgi:hypothetical protein
VHDDGAAYSDLELGLTAWQPASLNVDIMCPPTGIHSLWYINSDEGQNKNDLKAVLLSVWPRLFCQSGLDPRRTLGQDADGELAGSFFVFLAGRIGSQAFAETLTPWGASTYDENGFLSTAGNTAFGGRTATFVVVPEPYSIALLALTSCVVVAMVCMRGGSARKRAANG